jgi:ribosome assembly protein RRB1
MGKKSKSKRTHSTQPQQSRPAPSLREREGEEETAENLKFQDPFVDEVEVEVDEDVMDDDNEDEGQDDGDAGLEVVQSWHPLMGLPEGADAEEPLEMDPSAYKMYHTLTPEWPSLSFDFLRDDLGDARQRFPHSLQCAIGTQADAAENNHLTILRVSDLSKLPQDEEEDVLGDEYDKDGDDSSSSDEEENLDLDPVLEHYHLPHYGGVNRIRAMPQQSDIIATWSDVGKVYLYNVEEVRSRFAASDGKNKAIATKATSSDSDSPFFTHSGHGVEGYAMDWSLLNQGHLATGDNDGKIHLWTPRPEGSYEVAPSYESLGGVSVEDLQWSPTEASVFASAESGGHVAIYDTRAPNRAMLRHLVHENSKADVNVASWNGIVSNLLATGGDDGTLSVWDLRQFSAQKQKPVTPLARFSCHKTPITSIEWHPTDESMLAVSDSVGAYIYDLSVEEDMEAKDNTNTTSLVADIPPQLLFCHSGSKDFKELHWHPQISSCIMTTAFSGFSIFIPSNL